MIIWTGWGILTIIIPVAAMWIVEGIANFLSGDPYFYEFNPWVVSLGILIGAGIVWYLGNKLNAKPGRRLIDKATGQEVELKSNHTLFYIKMQYWAYVIAAFGIISLFKGY